MSDAPPLRNPRRLSERRARARRLGAAQGRGRRARVQRIARRPGERDPHAQGLLDRVSDARTHAVPARGVRSPARAQARGEERRAQRTRGVELGGKTLGVVGLGKLGAKTAQIARAIGMKAIAWSQNLTAERCREVGATLVSKEELFRRADFITVHLQLSPRTRGLIGAADLTLMKPTAYFINTSRGPIVTEAALIDVLRNKCIAGAGLDVYDVEPLPLDHPYRKLDNAVLTPHLGYVTEDNYREFYGQMVEDIRAFLAGKPVRVIKAK